MKRKNLIARKKAKSNKIIFKDSKILNFYNKFKSTFLKNIKNNSFALAVSGGSDSLCLAYFSKVFSSEFCNKMHVLIVDHNIRKDSQKEALKVKQILKKRKIQSKILRWKGQVPKSNVQKNARDLRYLLISNYCLKNKIKYLATAHHGDDQFENFFIRLLRGSGLTGLSSMSLNTKYNNRLKIVRPFLYFKKSDLKYVTLNYSKTYIKDPSNKDEKFQRIKIRKLITELETNGLDKKKLLSTINNLKYSNNVVNFYVAENLRKNSFFFDKDNKLFLNRSFFLQPYEVIFRGLSKALKLIGKKYYPVRGKKLEKVISDIQNNHLFRVTLGGCIVEKANQTIIITKEL